MIRSTLAVLAIAFALAHVPYVVSTLEDIDSVNFALGVRDFDVADHRPHPPGYPVYIALGKAGTAITRAFAAPGTPPSAIEATALSSLSLAGAIASLLLLYRVLASVTAGAAEEGGAITAPWKAFDPAALAATALTVACPLFWYMAVRPMSDMPGLAAALAAQACLALAWWRQQPDATGDRRLTPERTAASGQMIVLGALLTAIAIGFRAQNAVLTLPLLLGVVLDRLGRGAAGAMIGAGVAFALGTALWAVPLVVASGGVNAYLAALGSQAGEDFAGVEMLYLNPGSVRLAAVALMRTLIFPWDSMVVGGVVITLAAAGAVALLWRDRRAFTVIALLAFPYLAFHLLFHDTSFVRYALPLVAPVALLAVHGAALVARRAALPLVGALAIWSVSIAAPVLAAYGSEPSPVSRAVAAMQTAAAAARPGALAFHQTFRRPLQAESLDLEPQLPSPPRREWLGLVNYWRAGHTEPLWFLADPRRTDLALVDPRSRQDFTDMRWAFTSLSMMGGMRPAAVRWYRMPAPGWFAGEGWALTPETAGMARLMGRGPSSGPIVAWVRRRETPARVLVGGRHLGAPGDPAAGFAMAIDGREFGTWESGPGFFLEQFDLPPDSLRGDGLAELSIRATSGIGGTIPTAIEQFDLQSTDALMWAYENGWHEAEFTPALGVWRWTSERATLRVVGATSPIDVTLRVEPPRTYFDDDPIVQMMVGDQVVGQTTFAAGDTWTVTVPVERLVQSDGRITIETNRTFVPADRDGAADARHLGLRVFDVAIVAQH